MKVEKIECRASSREVFSMVDAKIAFVDIRALAGHTGSCPVKRRRATLGSDPLRDSRMRLRRITVRGSLNTSPPPFGVIQSCLLCLEKPRGSGGRAPGNSSLFKNGKIPFHAEPRH
jgi:hypothetical protein